MNKSKGNNFRYARSMTERVLSFLCVFSILFNIVCVDIPVRKAYTLDAVCICDLPEHAHNKDCYTQQMICKQSEHVHSESCYDGEGVLQCGLSEHVHTDSCNKNVLVCEKKEHRHSDACFRIEAPEENVATSMMLTNQEEGSGDQDSVPDTKPTSEPIANPTPEPAAQHTPEDATPSVPEQTDEPTDQTTEDLIEEPTPKPTEVSTANPTEEPTPTPETEPEIDAQLCLSDLKATKKQYKVNECIEWTFVCEGAESVRYEITDAKDNVVNSGEMGKARSVAWTPKRSGVYTIRIEAVRGDKELCLSNSVVVTADELKAKISTNSRSGFANEDTLRFECAVEGGVAPYEVSYTVYRDGNIKEDTSEGFQEFFSFMPKNFGTYTIVMRVVDAEENTGAAKCSIPVAVREKENERICLESMKNVQLTGDWAQDIVAIAYTQLGYRESERNFIIDEEGKMQGYTRYGDLRGMDYEEWCAMFVSFCADYAGIPKRDLPRKSNCARLKEALGSLYIDEEDVYCPEAGDYVFFHHVREEGKSESQAERNKPNHIGIVVEVDEEKGIVYTIEGNSAKSVRKRDYQLSDEQIVGYMSMRKAMECAGVLAVDAQDESLTDAEDESSIDTQVEPSDVEDEPSSEEQDEPSTEEQDEASTDTENEFAEEQELANGIVRIIANEVRLCSIASTEGDVLGYAYIGDEYAWLETAENGSETWYAIKLDDGCAYVRSDLAELIMEEVSDAEEPAMTDESAEDPAEAEQAADEASAEGDTIEEDPIEDTPSEGESVEGDTVNSEDNEEVPEEVSFEEETTDSESIDDATGADETIDGVTNSGIVRVTAENASLYAEASRDGKILLEIEQGSEFVWLETIDKEIAASETIDGENAETEIERWYAVAYGEGIAYLCAADAELIGEAEPTDESVPATVLSEAPREILEIAIAVDPEVYVLGDEVRLIADVEAEEGVQLQWQKSIDAIEWTDIEGANDSVYTLITDEENVQYYYRILMRAAMSVQAVEEVPQPMMRMKAAFAAKDENASLSAAEAQQAMGEEAVPDGMLPMSGAIDNSTLSMTAEQPMLLTAGDKLPILGVGEMDMPLMAAIANGANVTFGPYNESYIVGETIELTVNVTFISQVRNANITITPYSGNGWTPTVEEPIPSATNNKVSYVGCDSTTGVITYLVQGNQNNFSINGIKYRYAVPIDHAAVEDFSDLMVSVSVVGGTASGSNNVTFDIIVPEGIYILGVDEPSADFDEDATFTIHLRYFDGEAHTITGVTVTDASNQTVTATVPTLETVSATETDFEIPVTITAPSSGNGAIPYTFTITDGTDTKQVTAYLTLPPAPSDAKLALVENSIGLYEGDTPEFNPFVAQVAMNNYAGIAPNQIAADHNRSVRGALQVRENGIWTTVQTFTNITIRNAQQQGKDIIWSSLGNYKHDFGSDDDFSASDFVNNRYRFIASSSQAQSYSPALESEWFYLTDLLPESGADFRAWVLDVDNGYDLDEMDLAELAAAYKIFLYKGLRVNVGETETDAGQRVELELTLSSDQIMKRYDELRIMLNENGSYASDKHIGIMTSGTSDAGNVTINQSTGLITLVLDEDVDAEEDVTIILTKRLSYDVAIGEHPIYASAQRYDGSTLLQQSWDGNGNEDLNTEHPGSITVTEPEGWHITTIVAPTGNYAPREEATYRIDLANYETTAATIKTITATVNGNSVTVVSPQHINGEMATEFTIPAATKTDGVTERSEGYIDVSILVPAGLNPEAAYEVEFTVTDAATPANQKSEPSTIMLAPAAMLRLRQDINTIQLSAGETPSFDPFYAQVERNTCEGEGKDGINHNKGVTGALQVRGADGTWSTPDGWDITNTSIASGQERQGTVTWTLGEYLHSFVSDGLTAQDFLNTCYRFIASSANNDGKNNERIYYSTPLTSDVFYLSDFLQDGEGFRNWVLNPTNGYVNGDGSFKSNLYSLDHVAAAYQIYIYKGLHVEVGDDNVEAGDYTDFTISVRSEEQMSDGEKLIIELSDLGSYENGSKIDDMTTINAHPKLNGTTDIGMASIRSDGKIEITLNGTVSANTPVVVSVGKRLSYDAALGDHPIGATAQRYACSYYGTGELLQQSWDGNGIEGLSTETPGKITVTQPENWHITTIDALAEGSAFALRDKVPYTIHLANFELTEATIKSITATVGNIPVTVVVPRHEDGEMVSPYTLEAATVVDEELQRGNGAIPVQILLPDSGLTAGQTYTVTFTVTDSDDPANVKTETSTVELAPAAQVYLQSDTVTLAPGENPSFSQVRAKAAYHIDQTDNNNKNAYGRLEKRGDNGWETVIEYTEHKKNVRNDFYYDFTSTNLAAMSAEDFLNDRYRFVVTKYNAKDDGKDGITPNPAHTSDWFFLSDQLNDGVNFREWVLDPANGYVNADGVFQSNLQMLSDVAAAYQVYIYRGLQVLVGSGTAKAGEDTELVLTVKSEQVMNSGDTLYITLTDTETYSIGDPISNMTEANSTYGNATVLESGVIKLVLNQTVGADDAVEITVSKKLSYNAALGEHPINAHASRYDGDDQLKQLSWNGNGGVNSTETPGSITVEKPEGWHITRIDSPETAVGTGDTATFRLYLANFDEEESVSIDSIAAALQTSDISIDLDIVRIRYANATNELELPLELVALEDDGEDVLTPGTAIVDVTVQAPEEGVSSGTYAVEFALTDVEETPSTKTENGSIEIIAPTIYIEPDVEYTEPTSGQTEGTYTVKLLCKDLAEDGGSHALIWYVRDTTNDPYANWQVLAETSATDDSAELTLTGDALAALEALADSSKMQYRLKDAVSGEEYLSNATCFPNIVDMKEAAFLMTSLGPTLGFTSQQWPTMLDYLYYDEVAKDAKVPFRDKSTLMDCLLKAYRSGKGDSGTEQDGLNAAKAFWNIYRYDLYDPNVFSGSRYQSHEGSSTLDNVPDGFDFADRDFQWSKDKGHEAGQNGSPFHEVQNSYIKGLEQIAGQSQYNGSFFGEMEKTASAVEPGDANTDREYTVDLKAVADGILVRPTIIVFQIQTSWQMFDKEHASGKFGKVAPAALVTEMATLYDIKHSLIDFAEWLRNHGDCSVCFAITDVEHSGTYNMMYSPYFTNDPDTMIAGLRGWDVFGNCEHVHYTSSEYLKSMNAVQSENFAGWTNGKGVPLFADATKVAVIIGGSTEATSGSDGYGATAPGLSSNVQHLYTIRTNSGTPDPMLSWLDNSTMTNMVTNTGGQAYKDVVSREELLETYIKILKDVGQKNGNFNTATNVVLTDTIQDEFEYIPGTMRLVSIVDDDEVETEISDSDPNLTITYNQDDGTTTITYTQGSIGYQDVLHLRFMVRAKEDYIGSNNVLSNVGKAKIEYAIPFHTGASDVQYFEEEPQVNVPLRYTIEDGGETTVSLNDDGVTVNLWNDLAGEAIVGTVLNDEAEGIEDWSVRYDQINGNVHYQWARVKLDQNGERIIVNGVPSIEEYYDVSGDIPIHNGQPPTAGFPNMEDVFEPDAPGVYHFVLITDFTPEPKGNWTGINDAAVNKLTKYGYVKVTVVEDRTNLQLTKQDEDGNPIAGAVFELYEQDGANPLYIQPVYADENNTILRGYTLAETGSLSSLTEMTTDANGVLKLVKLPDGEYALREKTAPYGFAPLDAMICFSVENASVTWEAYTGESGEVSEDTGETTSYLKLDVVDEKYLMYDIGIVKSDSTNSTKRLSGASFVLYSDADEETPIAVRVDSDPDSDTAETFTTGTDGSVTLYGLPVGSYYLRETAAPANYYLIGDLLEFVLDADGSITTNPAQSVRISAQTVGQGEDAHNELFVYNSPYYHLTTTGGRGNYGFATAGLVIMSLAAGLFLRRRYGKAVSKKRIG